MKSLRSYSAAKGKESLDLITIKTSVIVPALYVYTFLDRRTIIGTCRMKKDHQITGNIIIIKCVEDAACLS
jgi:hypothetical protein